ncbi:MAG: hypothetical protein ACI9OJ_004285, partial [Myxococcota bacterium]
RRLTLPTHLVGSVTRGLQDLKVLPEDAPC